MRAIGKGSGWLHVALYLKQCAVCLMHYYLHNNPALLCDLSVPVSLTRKGIPRIIPAYHRKVISRRDTRADQLVKIFLSVFTLAKVIKLSKRVTQETFTSIGTPVADTQAVVRFARTVLFGAVPKLLTRYVPSVTTIPLHQGMTWDPTWKAVASKMKPFRVGQVVYLLTC